MLRYLRIGVLLLSVSLFGCVRVQPSTPAITVLSKPTPETAAPAEIRKLTQAQPIEKRWPTKFILENHTIERKHEGLRSYEISVDCPLVEHANTLSTRHFNKWMRRKIRGYVKQFESLERAAEIHDKRKQLTKVPIDESLEIGYVVYYSSERLISLRLTHTVMALGQMHPIDYYETINYDLRKQRVLNARDVFRRGYLKVFSGYSRKYLSDNYEISNDNWFSEGTAARPHNFENWNIIPGGILISFEDYQVSSHSFGQPELIVPYSELRHVVRKLGNSTINRG